jgi:tRNA 2-thiouridine synthesizing protein A
LIICANSVKYYREEIIMAIFTLDCCGLRCPQPILKIAATVPELKLGDVLEVSADCPTFEQDVRMWCKRMQKVLILVKDEGGSKKRCQIQF